MKKQISHRSGAAGSGKTSAALQRAAYLLYRGRGVLDARQIVLFSRIFCSTVMCPPYCRNWEKRIWSRPPFRNISSAGSDESLIVKARTSSFEYCLTEQNQDALSVRLATVAYKASSAFQAMIDRYAGSLSGSGLMCKQISFRETS